MSARAVVGLYEPVMTREQRRERAEKFAAQIAKAIQSRPRTPTAAILVAGRRIVCAVPNTEHYQELVGMKHSMLIGMYTITSELDRIARDVEETLSEYFEGCVIPTIVRA